MKKYIIKTIIIALVALSSCDEDFLTVYPTDSQQAGGPATEGAIRANLAGTYQILLFDSYANFQFNSIVLMSDLRSDDIFKGGGDAGDQGQLYRLSLLDATPTELPEGLWDIYYSGLARANNAIIACENAVDVDEDLLNEFKAEAHFLRAYFTHWLWKLWGNIPYYQEPLDEPYMATQYDADEIYEFIIADLDYAIEDDKLPMRRTPQDDGKASKAAAMMLKARVVLYQDDDTRFSEVLDDMAKIISSNQYQLMDDFGSIWVREGEFSDESIFEVNHKALGKDWGAAWTGYGTNLPRFISPNELDGVDLLSGSDEFAGGWGFGPVRPEVLDIYDNDDTRLAASINQFEEGTYTERFQDTGYFMAKYAARKNYSDAPWTPDLNFENNLRIFRYAETILVAAELLIRGYTGTETLPSAEDLLFEVRDRAGVGSIGATLENLKEERRREFLGEGLRFWDLVRWGDANILTEDIPEFSHTRTWEPYKKYLPLPDSEILKTRGHGEFELEQNPGY